MSTASAAVPLCPCPHCSCGFGEQREEFTVPPHSKRVKALISSNERPLDAERLQLHSSLEVDRTNSRVLEERESIPRASLNAVVAKKKSIDRSIRQKEGILGASRRIPEDVWLQIFNHVVDRDVLPNPSNGLKWSPGSTSNKKSSLDVASGPWVLGQVSALWRRMSQSHGTLWSTIAITAANIHQAGSSSSKDGLYTLLSNQLRFSKETELSVSIKVSESHSRNPPTLHNPLLGLVFSAVHRWKNLELEVPEAFSQTLNRFNSRLPRLQSASLHFNIVNSKNASAKTAFLQSAPSMRNLMMTGITSRRIMIPTSITHCTILSECRGDGLTAARAKELFNTLPSVEHFTVYSSDQENINPHAVASHPSLTSITVHGTGANLLSILNLPTLRTLEVHWRSTRLSTDIPNFIKRSSCTLTRLALTVSTAVTIQPVLKRTPALSELDLIYTSSFDAPGLVKSLCEVRDGFPSLVPMLGTLRFILMKEQPKPKRTSTLSDFMMSSSDEDDIPNLVKATPLIQRTPGIDKPRQLFEDSCGDLFTVRPDIVFTSF